MLTISNATVRLARNIRDAETAIDAALQQTSALLHSATLSIPHASGIDAKRVQTTLMRLQKSVGELVAIRGDTLRAHADLFEYGQELGMTEEKDCPDYVNGASLTPDRQVA